jgi:hypothetical protein
MDFTRWLAGHAHVIGPIGGLARDVASDSEWPEDGDLDAYREHLQEVADLDDDDPAMETLVEAWESYTLNCGPESEHAEPRT